MKKIILLLMLVSTQSLAWKMPANSPMCVTKSALDYYEIQRSGDKITEEELSDIKNYCDVDHLDIKIDHRFTMGLYSKVQAINYKNKREIYYVNTRDLIKD